MTIRTARSAPRTTSQIFLMPVILAVVSGAGLTFALLEDGLWDVASWVALSIPVAVPLACIARRAHDGDRA